MRKNLLLSIVPAYYMPHAQREDMGCVPFTDGKVIPFLHLPLQPLLHLSLPFLVALQEVLVSHRLNKLEAFPETQAGF